MLRIYEVYENDKHTDTLSYNQGLNELRESVEKLKIDRANEIGEGAPQKKMRVRDRHSTVKREKCLRIESGMICLACTLSRNVSMISLF